MSTPIEETVRFLKLYNKWRRDEDETILMPHPHDTGNAVDSAVSLLESLETANADLRAKVAEMDKTVRYHEAWAAEIWAACAEADGKTVDALNAETALTTVRAKHLVQGLGNKLREALEDKARLDWLDKEEFTQSENEFTGDDFWYCHRLIFDSEPISVRAAIDAARKEGV